MSAVKALPHFLQYCHATRRTFCRASVLSIDQRASGMSKIQEEKKALRKAISRILKGLDDDVLRKQSLDITGRVLNAGFFTRSKRIGLYLSCAKLREVDTNSLVSALLEDSSRRCYVPVVEDKSSNMQFLHLDTRDGVQEVPPFNIPEPERNYSNGMPRESVLDMEAPLDLLLMTGQAFDKEGHRLGRGGGYYDKFISRCIQRAKEHNWQPPLFVALAFQQQMVPQIPLTPNDCDMDIIVGPEESIACSGRGQHELQGTF